jgi:valyl-tRNA synthetase
MKQTIVGVTGTVQVLLPLAGVVDIGALQAKVEKDLSKIEKESQVLQARLGNPGFVNKAPQEVVQGARDALEQLQIQAQILRDRLKYLSD